MPLPSLYNRGVLIPHMGENKIDLNNVVGIDYIMDWFDKRIPINKFNKPLISGDTISDRVVILKSGTGSGKSTSIAPTLFKKFYSRWKNNQIILTQPTQLTTQSITYDINSIKSFKEKSINNPPIELFKNLGYQYKENVYRPIENGILVCTTGILLQILKNNSYDYINNKFNAIIVDEVHNRSIDIDLILYFLLQLVNYNIEKCPFIIIMSATIDPYKYSKYFNTKTIFEIKGLTFPITNNYLKINCVDYIQKSIELVNKIHLDNIGEIGKSNIDIIIFVHNTSILLKIYDEIIKLNNSYKNNYLLPIMLTGDIFRKGDKNYNYIFSNLKLISFKNDKKNITPSRRVIIGTNVAETGITIDTLKYCIDIGYVNTIEFNPKYNSLILLVKPETQASALQRKGRVGRKFEGDWYPLYTEKTFNSLLENPIPNLFNNEITFNILNILIKFSNIQLNKNNEFIENDEIKTTSEIKEYKNLEIQNINLLDKIPYDMSILSLKKLFGLGFIYPNSYPTKLGLLANKFQKIKIEHIKIICSGYKYKANIEDLITIIAYLIVGKQNIIEPKFKSFNLQFDEIDNECIDFYNYNKLKTRLLISCEFIDFLLFYKKFNQYVCKVKNISKIEEWCLKHKIKYTGILNITQVKDELIYDMIHKMNLNPYLNNNNLFKLLNDDKLFNTNDFLQEIKKIKHCLYEGLKFNLAIYNKDNDEYVSQDNGSIISIYSYLTKNLPILNIGKNFIQNKPYYIIYDSLIFKYDVFINKFIFTPVNCISVLDGYVNIDKNFIES